MLPGWTFCNCMQTKALATPRRSTARYVHGHEIDCDEDDDEYVFAITGEVKGEKVTGILVEMSIDSGASANVIGQAKWEQLKKRPIKAKYKEAA